MAWFFETRWTNKNPAPLGTFKTWLDSVYTLQFVGIIWNFLQFQLKFMQDFLFLCVPSTTSIGSSNGRACC